ncbi:hypothetical protein [Streptomyces sp. NPDC059761]|uniref:hypothetical protein n=1 Tax=Streptomyces sp. NPDC059761 TaxID=3346937 RepID=UPI003661CB91
MKRRAMALLLPALMVAMSVVGSGTPSSAQGDTGVAPAGVRLARQSGAQLVVEPFDDPIGRDAIVQFPGGVNAQLYWHTKAPSS